MSARESVFIPATSIRSRANSEERASIHPPIARMTSAKTEIVTRRRRRCRSRRTCRRREANTVLRMTLAGGRAILDLLEFTDEPDLELEFHCRFLFHASLDVADQ